MALAVLHCGSCGTPVALGDADDATCGACGTKTPIPADHRALRDAARWDAQARRDAEATLRTLDRPPGPLLRALAYVSRVPFFVVFLVLGVPLFLATFGVAWKLAARIADAMGWATGDAMSSALLVGVMSLLFYLMAIVPTFLLVYGGRRVTAHSLLVAALAARPPARPGGPASCRACGGPLTVEPDAVVVRCVYCRAENAVHVPAAHLKAARGTAAKIESTIAAAAEQDVRERRDNRRQLRRRLWRVTWKAALFFGPWVYAQHGMDAAGGPDGDVAGSAIAALVWCGLFLIYIVISSLASDD
jgi:cobalamin synthase